LEETVPVEEDIAAEEAHRLEIKKLQEACESEEDMCKILEEEFASFEKDISTTKNQTQENQGEINNLEEEKQKLLNEIATMKIKATKELLPDWRKLLEELDQDITGSCEEDGCKEPIASKEEMSDSKTSLQKIIEKTEIFLETEY